MLKSFNPATGEWKDIATKQDGPRPHFDAPSREEQIEQAIEELQEAAADFLIGAGVALLVVGVSTGIKMMMKR